MKNKILTLSILIAVLLVSCKSKQSLDGSGEKATSVRHLVKLIEQAQPSFTTVNASNISVGVNMNGKKMNVSANLKIQTDSIVVLSIIPFMGIELYSIELYRDKWIVFDKINRLYYTDNYEYLHYKLGIDADFTTFQSLFSARLFSAGEKEVDAKKLRFTPLEAGKNKLDFESKSVKQSTITYLNHTIEQVILTNKTETHRLTTTYNDYVESRGVNYPRNIAIRVFDKNDLMMSLDLKIQKINFNSDLKLSLSNTERYTQSSLDQLIK